MHGDQDRVSRHFAERRLGGLDDHGVREEVHIWIDWLPGRHLGCRARPSIVGSRENPSLVREDDWVFRGYEMQDALEAANSALSADLDVSRELGDDGEAPPFSEAELRPRLERWFLDQ